MNQVKTKSYFWILLDILIVAIIVNLIFFVMPAIRRFGGSLAPTRTLTVSAEGKTTTAPDLAESSFSVISRGKNPADLADNNNQKMSAVVAFIKSEGLMDKDIKTTNYNLSPDYKYDQQTGNNFITGYTLTQTVDVKMRDFKKVAEIVGGLAPLGVNQIGGISFSVEDQDKFLAEARADAFTKAKAKAEDMARESGIILGKVVSASESAVGPIPYYSRSLGGYGAVAPEVAQPTIEPGSQELKDQVTITYEIE